MSELKVNFSYPVVVLDTETGGINPDPIIDWNLNVDTSVPGTKIHGEVKVPPAPVLELASIVVDPITLEELDSFHSFCGPAEGESVEELLNRCHPKALEVNGFGTGERRKALETAPTMKEAINNWVTWLKFGNNNLTRPSRFLPCGQHVRFDIDMINAACVREGIDFQIMSQPLELITFSMLYFGLPNTGAVANYKLSVVAEALGISTKEAHTALADVRMTAQCLRSYLKLFTV